MLILNEEAAEYARKFEETEKSIGAEDIPELNTSEQVALYTITKMYMKDSAFRLFMQINVETFADASLNDKVMQLLDSANLTYKRMGGAE